MFRNTILFQMFREFSMFWDLWSFRSFHVFRNTMLFRMFREFSMFWNLWSFRKAERVASLQQYGAFIKIPGLQKQGLVHKSQMSKARVEDPSEMLSVGEKVYCKVISLENEKISLSMKVVNQTTGQDEDPANVQASMDQQRKRKVQGERPRIELGAVLDTTCKKCGGHGHLAQDCFHTKGGKVYELIPEPEKKSFFKIESDSETASPTKKKKKKDKKVKKSKKHKKHQYSSSDSSYDSSSNDEKRKKKHKKHKKQKHKKKHSRNSSLSDYG
ncbi:hypothetical protein FSP39_019517 [Pinctada imbricata]|uniref:Nucleolar protein of 40 kDa n=1 Tax=Pinctada imbricata TaxID=66713 RepID=A0AA88YDT1_PINIB|nr:hypothetical protein FSP39_019517 [Pinctada imbricata]